MSDIAVSVEGLGKQYRLGGGQPYYTLRDSFARFASTPWRWLRRGNTPASNDAETIWALRDVSFEVRRGEVVGIIGRNGAGKSTLLKILSQITEPTTGEINLTGRVGSLLEVGTGFHPELTGRENIFLNGAILGMKRSEIIRKFDEIVAFAEVEKFIDTPVKHYSSGMYMRLAFAVAAHLEPEILIVDEVLAVGDTEFQQKCLGRMQAVSKEGRTVLFVSHNMQAVSTLCDRGITLERGRIGFVGSAEEAIQRYLASQCADCSVRWEGSEGDDVVRLLATSVQGGSESTYRTDEPLRVRICIELRRPVLGLVCGVEIFNQFQQRLVYSLVDDSQSPPVSLFQAATYSWELTIPPNTFAAGNYRFEFDIGIHNVRRIIDGTGALFINLENVGGIGRRMQAHGNLIRPDWTWRLSPS